jgi:plastocyanin
MILSRRVLLAMGSGVVAALTANSLGLRLADAGEIVDIEMTGRADGSDVWFDPIGLWIAPGQTVRWTNRDAGDSHTATSYHPDFGGHPGIGGHPRRIPKGAKPWDSDYLLPDESFSITLTEPGVYDYYCRPHEHAGMVGRIVVGDPAGDDWWSSSEIAAANDGLPAAALAAFPPIEDIRARRVIHRG